MNRSRVLVIDDDRPIFEKVRALLEGIVGEVTWAGKPEEGIRQAINEQPDLILLDINMPRLDGLKVCRHLKETDAVRDIPVLFLTVERNVASLARALDCGGTDYILKPFNEVDLRARVRAALRTKRMIDLLKKQARIDALTSLSNRAALDQALDSAVASHTRHGQPFALLMLDVDHFKEVNDSHGHGVGDDVLREIASVLRSCCRPYDTPCRFGGDEFGVVLGQTDGHDANRVSTRILESFGGIRIKCTGGPISITCSAGLATTSELNDDFAAADVVKAADEALYRAKSEGRNRLCVAPDKTD